MFYFDCLTKPVESLEDSEKTHYWLLLKLLLWLLSNCYWETILIISVKVIYLCKGDFLSSKKVFDNLSHSQPSKTHHFIKVDKTVQYTL